MRRRLSREALALAALASLSWANLPDGGGYSPRSIGLAIFGTLLLIAAVTAPAVPAASPRLLVALTLATVAAYLPYAAAHHALAPTVVAIVCCAPLVIVVGSARRRRLVIALGATGLGGLLFQGWRWGSIGIDVFASVQAAAAKVLQGRNPYDAVFTTYVLTPPSRLTAERIHYQYGPLLPYLTAPGRLIGDVRVLSLVAFVALGACALGLARRSPHRERLLPVVTALCLGFPFVVLMVINAWVDVFMMAGFAGWLTLRARHPRWAVLLLAGALLVKPTLLIVLIVPLVWSRSMRRECCVAALAAALFTLPFALVTGPAQLYHDVIGVQLGFPPRTDSLTLSSALYWSGHGMVPGAVALIGTAAVALVVLRRRPDDLADVLLGSAVISTVSFVLAKWAYFNYYFIPAVLLVLYLASRGVPLGPDGDVATPSWARHRRRLGLPVRLTTEAA
ncbi:MAG: glycosyltransferase 87 family protein [Candidatus Dormibacteria bacterium]